MDNSGYIKCTVNDDIKHPSNSSAIVYKSCVYWQYDMFVTDSEWAF